MNHPDFTLPAGWEWMDSDSNRFGYYIISARGIGFVTIDSNRRKFRAGIVTHGSSRGMGIQTKAYVGRGWMDRAWTRVCAGVRTGSAGRAVSSTPKRGQRERSVAWPC